MDREKLDVLIEDAMSTMQELSGGVAACTFTRAGRPVPHLKYVEGRWAALRQVRRTGEVEAAQAEWETALEELTLHQASADWIAYRTGGVDALVEVAEARS